METTTGKLIPLDIAMDYPVRWGIVQILRDLIQNFYDSIGYENFQEEFSFQYKRRPRHRYNVTMKTYGHSFHYEWLTYVGGSTKTGSYGKYIGQYGEGFKICMLCLFRDYGCSPVMESQNWRISPCSYMKTIDGIDVRMLGYSMEERKDDGRTVLYIPDLPESSSRPFDEALLNFYYPRNPLFGKKLFEGEGYAVYERSQKAIPCAQHDPDFKGILYCNFLARGRLPFHLVILVKKDTGSSDTRKREVYKDYEIREILYNASKGFSPDDSYAMLMYLRRFWNDMPQKTPDILTWYYLICQLVRNVSKSKELCSKFMMENSGLGYIERKAGDPLRNKLIDETYRWFKRKDSGEIVNPVFRLLGVPSLVEEYAEKKESKYVRMSEAEKERLAVLIEMTLEIAPALLDENRPEVLISKGEEKKYQPLLFAERIYSRKGKSAHKRYRINKIVMNHSDFTDGNCKKAFLKFATILIHTYGASKSEKVNAALTVLGEKLIVNRERIEYYCEEWERKGRNGILY